MSKKWVYFVLLCLSLFTGCSSSPSPFASWMEDNKKIKVLSTIAMIDDMVAEIGKERIDHLCLIHGEIDPHSYELVKGDDEKIGRADLIFFNGLGLEHGASLHYKLYQLPQAVGIGDMILKTSPEVILKKGGQLDPHIWLDLLLWEKGIDIIVDRLSKIDPLGASFYQENGNILRASFLKLHAEIVDKFRTIQEEKKYLVTCHDAFNYFSRRYLGSEWENRFKAPEGLAPDSQLSCQDLQGIIDHLKKYDIHTIFTESNMTSDSLKKVASACAETNFPVKINTRPLYADTLGPKDSKASSYLKMMEYNTEVLIDAWKE